MWTISTSSKPASRQAWAISISQFVPFPVMTIALIFCGIFHPTFFRDLDRHVDAMSTQKARGFCQAALSAASSSSMIRFPPRPSILKHPFRDDRSDPGEGAAGEERLEGLPRLRGDGHDEAALGFRKEELVVPGDPLRRDGPKIDLHAQAAGKGRLGQRHAEPAVGAVVAGGDEPRRDRPVQGLVEGLCRFRIAPSGRRFRRRRGGRTTPSRPAPGRSFPGRRRDLPPS